MTRYCFARCELDTERHELKVAGIVRSVEPQVFDLLKLFVDRGQALVSHDELIRTVWHGRIVSDSAISVRINAARKAVGDTGAAQSVIRTIPRRGYQLAVPVTRQDGLELSNAHTTSANASPEASAKPLENKPVLAVFVFESEVESSRTDYLARGIADDIATELSRFHTLAVLSTFSTFQHDTRSADTHAFATSLGASHIVTGAMQGNGDNIRLTTRLTDVSTQRIIWSERYDIGLDEVFEAQDDAVSKIVGSLFSRLHEFELAVARRKPTNKLSAYDCVLRGLKIYKGGNITLEDAIQSLFWFDRAVEMDPDYPRALAWQACAGSNLWSNPPTTDDLLVPMRNIQRAISIDNGDHEVHRLKGSLHCILGEHDAADYHLSKSVELNPNDAHILVKIGYYKSFLGDTGNDLEYVDLAFRRNPLHPNWYWHDRGVVLFAHERYAEALVSLQRSGENIEAGDIYRAACFVATGNTPQAVEILTARRIENPGLGIDWVSRAYPYRCYTGRRRANKLRRLLRLGGLN